MAYDVGATTTIVYMGVSYTVPVAFADLYGVLSAAAPSQQANLFGANVGELEAALTQVEALIRSYNWSTVKAVMEMQGLHLNFETAFAYNIVADFAAGDFSEFEGELSAIKSHLASLPDAMGTTEALAGFGDTTPDTPPTIDLDFDEFLAGQSLRGTVGVQDAVGFDFARGEYQVTEIAGQVQIVGPRGGSAILSSVEKLVFSDVSYTLDIAQKAAAIGDTAVNALVDLYIAYFNRVPEASGLSYWIDQYASGKSLTTIAAEFYAAGVQYSEITGYSAGVPLGEFVAALYANVLGRSGANAPGQTDLDYWADQVATGAVTREGMVARFLSDARQFYDHAEVGWVPRLLDQKVEFGKLHAVTYGLDYNDNETSIETTVALAAAVTPTGYADAVAMVGLSADDYLV